MTITFATTAAKPETHDYLMIEGDTDPATINFDDAEAGELADSIWGITGTLREASRYLDEVHNRDAWDGKFYQRTESGWKDVSAAIANAWLDDQHDIDWLDGDFPDFISGHCQDYIDDMAADQRAWDEGPESYYGSPAR